MYAGYGTLHSVWTFSCLCAYQFMKSPQKLSFSNVFSFTRLCVKYSLFKQYINKHTCSENLSQRITQNYKDGVNKLARAIYDFVHNIAGSQLCMRGKLSADDILKDLSCFSQKIGVNISCRLSPKDTICME